jgi:hypothetical protein
MTLTPLIVDGFDHYAAVDATLGAQQQWQRVGVGVPATMDTSQVGYRGRGKRMEMGMGLLGDAGILRPFTDTNLLSMHIASKLNNVDVDQPRVWMSFRDILNQEVFTIQTLPTLQLALYTGATLLAHTAPITLSVAHRFNLWGDFTDPANCDVSFTVDGDRDNKGFHFVGDAKASTSQLSMIRLGQGGYGVSAPTVTNDHSFDDLVLCSGASQNIGELEVITQGPVGDVRKQWTPLTGTDNYAMVDDLPPNADTDYNSSVTPGNIDLQQFPVLPVTPDSIFCVSHFMGARKEEAGTRTIASVTNRTGDHVGVNQNLSTSYDWYYDHRLVDPETNAAWTVANRAATSFGYKDIA